MRQNDVKMKKQATKCQFSVIYRNLETEPVNM